MRFKPMSEDEIKQAGLIQPGVYPFEIIAAEEALSKSGNEMIRLQLKIWDNNNHERIVFDYLLEAMSFKLRHFAEATDLLHKYENGALTDHDCIGKSGFVELIIQKDKSGQYGDKNAVKDYMKSKPEKVKLGDATKKAGFDPDLNDDIPF